MEQNEYLPRWLVNVFIVFVVSGLPGCQQPDPSIDYEPVVHAYLEAWNSGDLDSLDRVADQHFVLRMSPDYTPITGLDSLKQAISGFRSSYPDVHITPDELVYAHNTVAIRWTLTATRAVESGGNAVARPLAVHGMSLLHFSGGKVLDEWVAANDLAWLQQLGYTLTPPGPAEEATTVQ